MQTLLDQVDVYRICDLQSDINKEYTSPYQIMYSDGEIHSTMNSDGFIHITRITNDPHYLLYVNTDNDITLNIYKNTPRNKFDEISDRINMVRNQTKIPYHGKAKIKPAYDVLPGTKVDTIHQSTTTISNPQQKKPPTRPKAADEVIDVNTFKCPKCNQKPDYYDMGNGHLIARCNKCKIDYVLVPSRYYMLESTRAYNKDKGIYARTIDIKPLPKTNEP